MKLVGYIRALAVVCSLAGVHAFAACPETPVRLITDFDDTMKITDVLNKAKAGWNMLFSHDFFTGVPEFYRGFAKDACSEIDVVSGGWDAFSKYTIRDLKTNKVKYEYVHERPNLDISIYQFKSSQLWESHYHTSEYNVLIGDDTESDPEVYNDFMLKFPGQVLAAYIHIVTGRRLPTSVIPYYSIFEVALMEHAAGRLSEKTAMSVAHSVLKNENIQTLFPAYAVCPESASLLSTQYTKAMSQASPKLNHLAQQVNEFMIKSCTERNASKNIIDTCIDILIGSDKPKGDTSPAK
jgi:Uncharacterized conserved protein (DUF2183)